MYISIDCGCFHWSAAAYLIMFHHLTTLPSCFKHLFTDDILLYIDDRPVSISSNKPKLRNDTTFLSHDAVLVSDALIYVPKIHTYKNISTISVQELSKQFITAIHSFLLQKTSISEHAVVL